MLHNLSVQLRAAVTEYAPTLTQVTVLLVVDDGSNNRLVRSVSFGNYRSRSIGYE